ncbi:MAG: YihY family inner membrane protein [Zetaproteobacteria bacterium]|nr:YihY family inner membrane protein [Zetaproteobacteria bacterium]
MFNVNRSWWRDWQQQLWYARLHKMPVAMAFFVRIVRVLIALVRDFVDGQITLRAMSLVYTTLLSLVPLLALTFSVLKGLGVHNQLEPILLNSLAALGDQGVEITQRILGFVENIKVGVLGTVGMGLLVYTVVALLHKVELTFNYIWQVKEPRTLAQRFSEYLSVLMVGPLLIFSALGLTASMMNSAMVQSMMLWPVMGVVVVHIGKLIPYVLVISAFTFVYMFMPNTRVRLLPAACGGVVAGATWQTAGWAFGLFVAGSGSYAAIYSGFAVVIVFLIWLFVSWMILLLGASVAYYVQNPERFYLKREALQISPKHNDHLALLIMLYVGRHFYHANSGWKIDDLAEDLGMPVYVVELTLQQLQRGGVVVATEDSTSPYVPARDLSSLRVRDILQVIYEAQGESSTDASWLMPEQIAVDSVMTQLSDARNGIGELTLLALLQSEGMQPNHDGVADDVARAGA